MTDKKRRVDVYDTRGHRVYVDMIDDPKLPYLYWGDGYGFILRATLRPWRIVARRAKRGKAS